MLVSRALPSPALSCRALYALPYALCADLPWPALPALPCPALPCPALPCLCWRETRDHYCGRVAGSFMFIAGALFLVALPRFTRLLPREMDGWMDRW